jgi:hypothetical protein
MHNKKSERRRAERKSLKVSCPTSIVVNGTRYPASMLDFSEVGARFTLDEPSRYLDISSGADVTVELKNQYGETTCGGKVAWIYRIDDRYLLGVEFSELSSDKRDPLRCLMESTD